MFIIVFCDTFGCWFSQELIRTNAVQIRLPGFGFSDIIWSRLSRFLQLITEEYHPMYVIVGGIIVFLTPCPPHNKGWSKKGKSYRISNHNYPFCLCKSLWLCWWILFGSIYLALLIFTHKMNLWFRSSYRYLYFVVEIVVKITQGSYPIIHIHCNLSEFEGGWVKNPYCIHFFFNKPVY